LPLVQLAGSLHTNFDEQVALAMPVQHRHAFAADAHGGAGLRPLGDFQIVLTFKSGDANLGSQRGLAERHRNYAVQIRPFALKERMLLDVQDHVEIACRAAKSSGFTQTGKTDARTIFDSGGNFGLHGSLPQNPALPFALGARIGDDAASALTSGTGAGHAEEPLLVAHLSTPRAGAAGDRRLTLSGARTAAIFTGLVAANGDLSLFAENRLFKFQGDILAQVRAALSACAAATAAEEIAKAEKVAENLAEIVEDGGIDPARSANSGVTEAVVGGALVGIRQDGVGFAALFELLFRVGIIGVTVRVKLQRQFAVGAFDLLIAGPAGNPEDLVVIAFYVAGQNGIFAFPKI
jgi:hypothetical protein